MGYFLSSYYGRIVEELGLEIMPGAEFAEAHKRCPFTVLGDRPVSTTLNRCTSALSWWESCKLFYSLAFEDDVPDKELINKLVEDSDLISEMLKETAEELPSSADRSGM